LDESERAVDVARQLEYSLGAVEPLPVISNTAFRYLEQALSFLTASMVVIYSTLRLTRAVAESRALTAFS
jgi:hypothetical protein